MTKTFYSEIILYVLITRCNQCVHDTLTQFLFPVQFVDPGTTEADSSQTHVSIIDSKEYPYWPNRTVDGNFSQNIKACLHTAVSGVTEGWLRIDLLVVKSIKSVKFWYRNDSK